MSKPGTLRRIAGWPGMCVLGTALAIFGFLYGGDVDLDVQENLYEGLRNTSAIIFGVMGAWIAIVYPRALSRLLDASGDEEDSEVERVRLLLLPMLISTGILSVMLISAPLIAVLRHAPDFDADEDVLARISFAVLLVLTLLQFWALLYTLVPLGMAEADVANHAEDKRTRGKLTSHQQRRG